MKYIYFTMVYFLDELSVMKQYWASIQDKCPLKLKILKLYTGDLEVLNIVMIFINISIIANESAS